MAKKKSKLDQLLELVKDTENPDVLKLIEEVSQEKKPTKSKKTIKKSTPRKKKSKKEEDKSGELPDVTVIDGNVGFKKNLFKDDGTLCENDKLFDKRFGMKPQERNRAPATQVDLKCSRCSKSQKVFPYPNMSTTFYICPKCARG
jgi:hypothetical protein